MPLMPQRKILPSLVPDTHSYLRDFFAVRRVQPLWVNHFELVAKVVGASCTTVLSLLCTIISYGTSGTTRDNHLCH